MKKTKLLMPIIGIAAVSGTVVPMAVGCNDTKNDTNHKITVSNLNESTHDLFDIVCSKDTFNKKDIEDGLKVSFQLVAKGGESFDDYAFVPEANLEITTTSGETILLSEGFTWDMDIGTPYVWDLSFTKGADVVRTLTSCTELKVRFRVQNFDNIPVQIVDQNEQEVAGLHSSTNDINLETFASDPVIELSSTNDIPITITKIEVTDDELEWQELSGDGADYSVYSFDEYSPEITFTSDGLAKLAYYWYVDPIEILRINVFAMYSSKK